MLEECLTPIILANQNPEGDLIFSPEAFEEIVHKFEKIGYDKGYVDGKLAAYERHAADRVPIDSTLGRVTYVNSNPNSAYVDTGVHPK